VVPRRIWPLLQHFGLQPSSPAIWRSKPPFAQALSVASSAANPTEHHGFWRRRTRRSLNTYAIDSNYRIGYAQSWSSTVQHDLPFSFFGTAGYLGTKARGLDQQFIPNSVAPERRNPRCRHSFIYETSGGRLHLSRGGIPLNRRFHSGVMAHASYSSPKSDRRCRTGGRGQGAIRR